MCIRDRVISARNPVHSVLYLILTFFNAAGLFLLTGAEFLAMILLVVYVGAVAVLFLLVVMMLGVDFVGLKQGALQYSPLAGLGGGLSFSPLDPPADAVGCRAVSHRTRGAGAGPRRLERRGLPAA